MEAAVWHNSQRMLCVWMPSFFLDLCHLASRLTTGLPALTGCCKMHHYFMHACRSACNGKLQRQLTQRPSCPLCKPAT